MQAYEHGECAAIHHFFVTGTIFRAILQKLSTHVENDNSVKPTSQVRQDRNNSSNAFIVFESQLHEIFRSGLESRKSKMAHTPARDTILHSNRML